MTVPGQYVLQNGFNGAVGQAVFGPPGMAGGTYGATLNAAVPAGQSQEVACAGPVPAAMANVPVGSPIAVWIGGAAGSGELIPYGRMSALGVATLCTANLGAVPAGFGPTPILAQAMTGRLLHALPLQGAVLTGTASLQACASPGVLAARASAEVSPVGPLVCNKNTLLIANPTAALPAGFAMGYARPGVFNVGISLANLTAGGLDPGVTNWNVHLVTFDNTIPDQIPSGQNGPVALRVIPGVTFTFPLIAGASVVEATAAISDLHVGDGVLVCPRLAMPNVTLAPSHSRVSAEGVLSWGMANIDPAVGVTPGAMLADVAIFSPVPVF